MRTIHQSNHLFQAHLVKHALEEADIPAFVLGESLIGGMGELPSLGLLRVCVPESQVEAAAAVVAGLALDMPLDDPIWNDDEQPGIVPA